MCCQHNSIFIKGIIIAIWTIIQTSFHIVFVLGGYYICQFKSSHYLVLILYITYFYDFDKCGSFSLFPLENYHVSKISKTESTLIDLQTNATDDEDDINKIIQTIMEQAIFPRQTYPYFRTQLYIFIYTIHDSCWILSTFLLFAGMCFQVKKCLSTLFYVPWLLTTGISLILDVVAAVHFGLDMLHIYVRYFYHLYVPCGILLFFMNYTSWLKFIGVTNYKEFTKFNQYRSSNFVPHTSSIIIVLFFARLLIFWSINIITLFTINSHFLLAYVGSDTNFNAAGRRTNNRAPNGINSSESRIRNWQIFYGTVDTSPRNSSIHSEKDGDSSKGISILMSAHKRNNSEDSPRPVAGNSTTRYSIDSNIEYLSSTNSSPKITSSYIKFPDVVEGMDNKPRKYSTDSPKHEVPWSYLRHNENPSSILGNYGESSKINSKDRLFVSNDISESIVL